MSMEKVRYPIDWRVLLIAGSLALIYVVAVISTPDYPQALEFNIIFGGVFLFTVLNYAIGTYGLLNRKTGVLSRTDYLFYTKRLNVKDIKTIYYRPTWIVGGLTRSLYIVDDKEKTVEFPNVGWYEPVLAKIVRDLQSLNPSIRLDEHAEALREKYPQS